MKGFLYHQRQTLTKGKARLKRTLMVVMSLLLAGDIACMVVFAYFSSGVPCSYANKLSYGEQPYCRFHSDMNVGTIITESNDGGLTTYLVDQYPPIIPPGSGATVGVDDYIDPDITSNTILTRSYFLLEGTQFSFNISVVAGKGGHSPNETFFYVMNEKGYRHFELYKVCEDKYTFMKMNGTSFVTNVTTITNTDLYYFTFYTGESNHIDVHWNFQLNYSTFNLTGVTVESKCENRTTCTFYGVHAGKYMIATYNGLGSITLTMNLYYNYIEVYGVYLFAMLSFLIISIVCVILAFKFFYSPMKYISRAEILAQASGINYDDDDVEEEENDDDDNSYEYDDDY